MTVQHFLGRLLKGVSWFLLARVASAGSLLVINVLLARLLTLQEFGLFVLLLSIVTIVGTVSAVGIGTACTRTVAEARALERWSLLKRTVLVGFLLTAGIGLVLALLAFLWPVPLLLERVIGRPLSGLESACLGVWLVALAVRITGGYVYRGLQLLALAALFQGTAGNIIGAVILLLVAWSGQGGGLAVPLAVMAAAAALAALVCWLDIVRRLRALPADPRAAGLAIRTFLHMGGFLSLATLFQSNGREVCVWVASAVTTLQDVALLGAASRLVQVIELPVVVMNQALQPFIAEFGARGGVAAHARALRLAVGLVFPVMAALVLMTALVGDRVLALVFRPEFAAAQPILVWLMLGRLVQAFFGPSFAVLSMTGHERLLARDAALQFGMLAVLGALGGWLLGGEGVAVAFFVTLASFAVYRTITVRRQLGIWLLPLYDVAATRDLLRAALRRRPARPAAPPTPSVVTARAPDDQPA